MASHRDARPVKWKHGETASHRDAPQLVKLVLFIHVMNWWSFVSIDDELMELAAQHNINLKGYKHVIETSGIQHSQNRHGNKSSDRTPLSLEDYMLIPFIIRNRDKVSFSPSKMASREKKRDIVYEKDRLPIRICWRNQKRKKQKFGFQVFP